MARRIFYLVAVMTLTSTLHAQSAVPTAPRDHDVYCAGGFTMTPPPSDTYIISGVESSIRTVFTQGNLVFINRGSKQGVQVGNEFLVSRPISDHSPIQWFVWQRTLTHAMGTEYADIGRIRVVHVDADTSTAEIVLFCDLMYRGDIVLPFTARPAPSYKPAGPLDIFAPSNGKGMAMVVGSKDFGQVAWTGKVVYVNLGTAQGARVGAYYRVFRYQGDRHSTVYSEPGTEHAVFGYGAAPASWNWSNVPREILGEGLVLSATQNSSTVLITDSLREIYMGDYVEIE